MSAIMRRMTNFLAMIVVPLDCIDRKAKQVGGVVDGRGLVRTILDVRALVLDIRLKIQIYGTTENGSSFGTTNKNFNN